MLRRSVPWPALLIAAAPPPPAAPPVEAQLPWWYRSAEVEAGHYWIKTDLPAAEARAAAHHLDLVHEQFSARLWSLPARAPAPMNVLLFAREEDYNDTLRVRFGVDSAGTGGMFFVNPTGSALALWTGDLPQRRIEHVLQHEAFHQFAFSRFGGDLPPWVNEGLAELFGDAVIIETGSFVGRAGARAVESVKSALRASTSVPFPQMLAMTSPQWSDACRGGNAGLLYDQAWSMVLFLIEGEGGRYAGVFERYLRLVNSGHAAASAFAQAFEAEDLGDLEARWKRYALDLEPDGFATAVERIEFLAEGALDLARHHQVPGSLTELKESLQDAGFIASWSGHGHAVGLKPSGEMFEIPWKGNEELRQRPHFVVSPPRPGPARLRKLEEICPTPPQIETVFLKPRDLSIRWLRDEHTGLVRYEIDVRPPQR